MRIKSGDDWIVNCFKFPSSLLPQHKQAVSVHPGILVGQCVQAGSCYNISFLPSSVCDLGLPGDAVVKNVQELQEMQELQVGSLGQEDPLEEEMATYSSVLA